MESNGRNTLLDEEKVKDDLEDDIHTKCGLGSWRPKYLQRFANIKAFTFTLSMWSLFGSMNFSYYSSVISEIERQFGLPSSITGLIKNVDNIGVMATGVIAAHLLRSANKPIVFFYATILSSTAIAMFGLPHFIYGTKDSVIKNKTITLPYLMCYEDSDSDFEQPCGGSQATNWNLGALLIFCLSELLQGIGQSPKFSLSMTYMDDNSGDKAPRYFSIMFALRAFSPFLGFLMGAWAVSIYVDLSFPNMTQDDPKWIGAWWLGFFICAACSIFWAFPMLLFPPVLRGGDKSSFEAESTTKLKELPTALKRVFTSKLYVLIVIAICFEVQLIGYGTFLPKYISSQYGKTASMSSIITGLKGCIAYGLGPVVAGFFITSKKLSPMLCMKIVCVCTGIAFLGLLSSAFLDCPDKPWAGDITVQPHNLSLPCNSNCSCNQYQYEPVCGDDINYFSPCHAGCTVATLAEDNKTKIFTDCTCVDSGVAILGKCPKDCTLNFWLYFAIGFVSLFLSSMDKIPTMVLVMRSVEYKDKALSVGAIGCILNIASFPAPVIFGMLADNSCLVHQYDCSNNKGACLLYDSEKFRYSMFGLACACKFAALVIYLYGLHICKNFKFYESPDAQKDKNVNENESNM